jgi:hypothetical protein
MEYMNNKIQFVSTIDGLDQIEEYRPKPAKAFIPDWFKNIPSNVPGGTVRDCPSFPDYFSLGYIIPMWADVILSFDKNTSSWYWETRTNKAQWGIHDGKQFLDYTVPKFNGIDGQFVFKAISPWRIITPPGWSVLQLPLFYHFNQDWSVLPGVLDTDLQHEANQQVLYHSNKKEIKIDAGTPFVLYVPFKRSDRLELEVRGQTEKDKKKFQKDEYYLASKYNPNGIYRKLQRQRDKNG